MQNSGTRIFGYDLIKTIAIFLIVFYHLGGIDIGEIEPGNFYYPNCNKFLLSFCAASVPLFLMVHGALILPRQLDFKKSILKAAKMLLWLLFGKVVLQKIVLEKFFCIDEEMVHLWFLGTLAMVYVISYFMNRLKWLQYIILLILFIYPFLSNILYECVVYFKPDSNFYVIGHDGFFTFYALVYFYLGYYLKHKTFPRHFSFFAIIVGLLLINFEVIALSNYHQSIFDGVNGSFPTIGALALSLGSFLLLKDTSSTCYNLRNSIGFIGSNTLGIYIFHVLVIFLIRKYTQCESLSLLSSITLTSFIILVIAIFSHFIKRCFVVLLGYQNN